tara:strand:+ start:338 stop:490 length:153 start_codon:yes stop_codon:yes gene_type:complete
MKDSKRNNKEEENINIEESAINHKANKSDGKEINPQVEQRREQHQPRDNA